MIQGAPGVGKTALIDVLAREASDQGWKTAHIGTNSPWKPDDLLHRLGKKSNPRIKGATVEAGVDKYVKASAALSVKILPVALTMIKMGIIYLSTQRMEPFDFGKVNRHNRIDTQSTLLLIITST